MFERQNLKMISKNFEKLFRIDPKSDPILGLDSDELSLLKNFPKRHGTLLEKALLGIIKKTVEWEGFHQKQFHFSKKLSSTGNKRKVKIDNLVINRKLNIALFIEQKRILSNSDSGSMERIGEYHNWCDYYSSEILKELKMPSGCVRFAVFDAYGQKSPEESKIPDTPILRPKDLKLFFPSVVFNLLALVEHCILIRTREMTSQPIEKREHLMSRKFEFGNSIATIEQTLIQFVEQFEYSENSEYLESLNLNNFLQQLQSLTYVASVK